MKLYLVAVLGLLALVAWDKWKINEEEQLPLLSPKTFGLPLTADVKVIVMLAGWPDDHTIWKSTISEFEAEYHIVSITSPDHDQSTLRKPWGYSLNEVPQMINSCLQAHLGSTKKVDTLISHDWGAIWGYYLLPQWSNRVGRLVAVDIGASPHDDPSLPAGVPGVTFSTWYSMPYQLILAIIFSLGSGVSSSLADFVVTYVWPLMPLLSPEDPMFDWHTQAARPQAEVKWWMGYTYWYLWKARLVESMGVPSPLFPKIPTLFMYGAKKRTMFHSEAFLTRLRITPGCRVKEYIDSGHWLMITETQRFNDDVRRFLAEKIKD